MEYRQISRRQIFAVKAFTFFVYGVMSVFYSFFPLYLRNSGLDNVQIGFLMAFGPLVSIFANPFWGYWSDRLQNVKRTMLILLTGSFCIFEALFLNDSFLFLLIGLVLFFFFQNSILSQNSALILQSIEGTIYQFGSFRLWGSLGWALIAVAVSPVLELAGIGNLWAVYGGVMLLAIAFASTLPAAPSERESHMSWSDFHTLFLNRPFYLFLLLSVFVSIPNSMHGTFGTLYISELGGSSVAIGWSSFITAIFEIPVFLLFDRYLRNDRKIMILCLALIAVLYSIRWLMLSFATGPAYVILFQAMHSITFGGYYYIGTSLTAQLVPSRFRASGQAAYTMAWGGLSGVIAGIFGGWIFDTWGARVMYQTGAWMALICSVGFLLLWRLGSERQSGSVDV